MKWWALPILAAVVLCASTSHADDETTEHARAEFVSGVKLAGGGQWGEALAAFERSASLKPHALTTYNIATCERALGSYTRARRSYAAALKQNEANGGGDLPASFAEEAKARRAEIDGLLVHVRVALDPVDATVAMDGRPLVADEEDAKVLVAGVGVAGPGTTLPSPKIEVLADPGDHVITLQRQGFDAVVVRKTFKPSSQVDLALEMSKLPATLRISSSQPSSVVVLDGHDLGIAPVEVIRPAGVHALEVSANGFQTYRVNVSVSPGEQLDMKAPLDRKPAPLTARWWFWTGIGVIIAGAVATSVGVYYATRTPEPPNGGTLGWVAPAP